MVQEWILNASPLILLHKIDFLETMSKLAKTWLIPEAVAQEIGEKRPIDDYVTQLSVKAHVDKLKPHFDNLVTAGIRIDENLMKELLRTFGESQAKL